MQKFVMFPHAGKALHGEIVRTFAGGMEVRVLNQGQGTTVLTIKGERMKHVKYTTIAPQRPTKSKGKGKGWRVLPPIPAIKKRKGRPKVSPEHAELLFEAAKTIREQWVNPTVDPATYQRELPERMKYKQAIARERQRMADNAFKLACE